MSQLADDTARPAFRAINPIGKVPTVVFDDGRMLSESGAILHYLAAARDSGRRPLAAGAGAALDVLRAVQP